MAKAEYIACPFCAERIRAQAKLCRFCKMVIDPEGLARLAPASGPAVAAPPIEKAVTPAPAASDRQRPHIEEFLAAGADENRVATVLFIDISGYTSLSQAISTEDMKTLVLDDFYRLCSQAVEFYNGTVVKFMGDAALAVFGGPRAYERDAESAVRAALLIRERVGTLPHQAGQPLRLHAGIATGEILASSTQTSGQIQFDVLGHSVNLATRIATGAAADAILICPTTQDMASGVFKLKRLAQQAYKGIKEPVTAYEVLGEKQEDVNRRDFSIPFVGRGGELDRMNAVWDEFRTTCLKRPTRREKRPQGRGFPGVLLTGEAGIGKSRLAREFLRRVAQATPSATRPAVLTYEANPYDSKMPYGVWRALLGELAGGDPRERATVTPESFKKIIAPLKMQGDPFLGLRAMLGHKDALAGVQFLGVDFLRRQIVAEMRLFWERIALRRATILVLDDLQWADHASLELLEALFTPPGPAGIFVVASCRTETGLPGELKKNWAQIRVPSLPEKDRREVLRRVAPAADLTPNLLDLLALHSGGNPLYLLELQRHVRRQLQEMPQLARLPNLEETLRQSIPLTLKNMIQARIDQLERQRKTVLQCGAVIGKRFTYRLIGLFGIIQQGLLEQLYTLTGLEFLESTPLPPDVEFSFRHHMVRETAYQTMLLRQRRQLHLLIALRMERAYKNKLDDYLSVLAFHFDKGNDRPQAVKYYRLAGDRAKAQAAASDAIGFYDKAIDYSLEEGTAESEARAALMLVEKGRLLRNTGQCPQSLEAFSKARGLAAAASHEALFAVETGLTHMQMADYDAARREFKRAGTLLAGKRDSGLKAMLHNGLGICSWGQGEFDQACRHYQQTLGLAEKSGSLSLVQDARNNLALLDWKAGRLSEALKQFRLALQLARKSANRFAMALTMMNMAIIEENLGHLARAERQYQNALKLAEAIQFLQIQGAALCNLGNLHLVREEWMMAQECCTRALALARDIRDQRSAAIALENLALGQMGLRQEKAFRASLQEARAIARKTKDRERLFSLELVEIEWLIRTGGAGRALQRIDAADRELHAQSLLAELPRLGRLRVHALVSGGGRDISGAVRLAEAACRQQGNNAERIRLHRILRTKKALD